MRGVARERRARRRRRQSSPGRAGSALRTPRTRREHKAGCKQPRRAWTWASLWPRRAASLRTGRMSSSWRALATSRCSPGTGAPSRPPAVGRAFALGLLPSAWAMRLTQPGSAIGSAHWVWARHRPSGRAAGKGCFLPACAGLATQPDHRPSRRKARDGIRRGQKP